MPMSIPSLRRDEIAGGEVGMLGWGVKGPGSRGYETTYLESCSPSVEGLRLPFHQAALLGFEERSLRLASCCAQASENTFCSLSPEPEYPTI